jgi:hypothetical protein
MDGLNKRVLKKRSLTRRVFNFNVVTTFVHYSVSTLYTSNIVAHRQMVGCSTLSAKISGV